MTMLEVRTAIESRVPVWVLFVPLVGGAILWLISKENK